jgi:hypothetical protein
VGHVTTHALAPPVQNTTLPLIPRSIATISLPDPFHRSPLIDRSVRSRAACATIPMDPLFDLATSRSITGSGQNLGAGIAARSVASARVVVNDLVAA